MHARFSFRGYKAQADRQNKESTQHVGRECLKTPRTASWCWIPVQYRDRKLFQSRHTITLLSTSESIV